ncbi:hypothetical protein CsSME_00030741 [Camellia sinensis var. sinensis]
MSRPMVAFTLPPSAMALTLFMLSDFADLTCFDCIDSPSQSIIKNCPNQKEAIEWGPTRCIVRCSNKSFFGVMNTHPAGKRLTYWVSDIVERLDSGHPSKMAWIRTASKLFMIFRRGGVHHADEDASQSVDSFQLDFATIRAATNNFSSANKLGEGGFGFVYKGKLSIGQEIAV